jgi:hypothetical protein
MLFRRRPGMAGLSTSGKKAKVENQHTLFTGNTQRKSAVNTSQ